MYLKCYPTNRNALYLELVSKETKFTYACFVFLQEYSLIMSERDSVHKEIEKFQEEIKEKNKKLAAQDGRHKHHEDEVNRVSLNQDLILKLGIWTDLTKFRALDNE